MDNFIYVNYSVSSSHYASRIIRNSVEEHEGVSKSFRTESITK